jgi:hypothetical protein
MCRELRGGHSLNGIPDEGHHLGKEATEFSATPRIDEPASPLHRIPQRLGGASEVFGHVLGDIKHAHECRDKLPSRLNG